MTISASSLEASGTSGEGRLDSTGPRPLEPGLPAVFGRYLLIQRLSRGGMGEIFLAKHGLAGFEKLCVIKKVLPTLAEDEQFISRFIDEAQVAIKLQHVNIAQVFEVGRVGDEYFLALEYVEGRDLRRTLTLLGRAHRQFPADLALFVGRELANGLAYAHRRTGADGSSLNLVHCDISPPNVLVSFEGETKIIDFGIAKSAIRATATDPKMGFGKFGYMAPEQLVRGGMVDARTDIYAVGVVLFELLTGQRLYDVGAEPDYRALARMVVKGEHRLPSHLDPMLAPFDDLVARALRPKPEDRYQTAAELRDAIQAALVAFNPTTSTDHLASFLRDLFAQEMASQRELLDRAAAAHLADFEHQLTTQSTATVSFALANMPLYQPPTQAVPRIGRPASGPSVVVAGVTGGELTAAHRRRRRTVIAASAAAALGLAVGLAFALSGGGKHAAPAVATIDAGVAPLAVQAMAPDAATAVAIAPPGDTIDAAPEIQMPLAVVQNEHGLDHPAVGAGSGSVRHGDKVHDHDKDPKEGDAPDAAALRAKFQALIREYKQYQERNGRRLEAEWTDAASMVGYLSTPEKRIAFDKKIDRFRARMRE